MVAARRALLSRALVLALGGLLSGVACSSFSGDDGSPADSGGPPSAGDDGAIDAASGRTDAAADAAPPPCDAGAGSRACDELYVFVTNDTLRGDFAADAGAGGALPRADAFCKTQAEAQAKYPDLHNRKWRAWLCTAAETAVGHVARAEAQYITPEHLVVFPTLVSLRATTPSNAIGFGATWTGCAGDGTNFGFPDCMDWTTSDTDAGGQIGLAQDSDPDRGWVSTAGQPCSSSSPLYCFEQLTDD